MDFHPTFSKHIFAGPSEADQEQFLPLMPHLTVTYPLAALGEIYAKSNANVTRLDCRLEPRDIDRLRARAEAPSPNQFVAPDSLSNQDIVTAWIITVLNRCSQEPIRSVTNAASVRHLAMWHILRASYPDVISIAESPHLSSTAPLLAMLYM
jgi:hypothetical protein